MKILFLTDYWSPVMTANSVCVKNIAEALIREGNDVYVCAYETEIKNSVEDGVRLSYVKPSLARRLLHKSSYDKNSKLSALWGALGKTINRGRRLLLLPFYPRVSISMPKRWCKCAKQIIDEQGINVVVSVIAPDEALYAGYLIKRERPHISWIAYYIDGGTNTLMGSSFFMLKTLLHDKAANWENRVLKDAARIIVMEGHYDYYKRSLNDENANKLKSANVPLLRLTRRGERNPVSDSEAVQQWVYSGNMNGRNYDPHALCSFFAEYCKSHEATLHLYGPSNHRDYLASAEEKCPSIVWHGTVRHDEVLQAQSVADVLVYYCCLPLDSVSGKLFEYLPNLKPIIYIGPINDINANQLAKYRFGISVDIENSVGNQVREVEEFIESLKDDTNVSLDEIAMDYRSSLAETTAALIAYAG